MKYAITLLFSVLISLLNAQVKIGQNTQNVDPSAALEIESTTGGFLPPRMNSAQRDLLLNPPVGLMIINTDFNCMEYYRGSSGGWFSMCPTLATLTTTSITSVTGTSATSGGSISNDGGATITSRGVCWNTSPNPTTDDSYTTNGLGIGSFTSQLTGLSMGTTYYVRAYAANSAGIAYGNELSFSTPDIPTVSTTAASSVFGKSAVTGGLVISDGGAAVTARGICWSTSPLPTTSDNIVAGGSGLGSFTSLLSGLSYSSSYYVRAYATNAVGTAYGNEITVTTTSGTVVQFTSTGSTNWTVPEGVTAAEVLVVAGGGSGGGQGNSDGSGGGGAGGLVYEVSYSLSPGASIPVTVGAGGAGVSAATVGNNGGNSVFGTITAIGGGGGGTESDVQYRNGRNGGSGGGAGGYGGSYVGGQGTPGQGNNGGNNLSLSPNKGGGGGGGAGSPGIDGGYGLSGHASGGNGLSYSISGSAVYYAGGGGDGGGYGGYGGEGGLGGGGKGGNSISGQSTGVSGTPNSGGGGGGAGGMSSGGAGNSGSGGSGIVIIRY